MIAVVYCVFANQGPAVAECLVSVWADRDAADRECDRLNAEGGTRHFVEPRAVLQ